jgi:hypothetical protein
MKRVEMSGEKGQHSQIIEWLSLGKLSKPLNLMATTFPRLKSPKRFVEVPALHHPRN